MWLLLLWPGTARAQAPPSRWGISLAYFGEFVTHPGVTISAERYLFNNGTYQVFVGAQAGGYVHRRNHTGLFVGLETGHRITMKSGLFFDQHLGLGYLHTFLNGGDVFEADALRGAYEVKDGGRGHVMPSVSVGTGWTFRDGAGQPRWSVFARPVVFWQYPFNNYALVHPALQAGATYLLPAR